jgi:hypothetical protein
MFGSGNAGHKVGTAGWKPVERLTVNQATPNRETSFRENNGIYVDNLARESRQENT